MADHTIDSLTIDIESDSQSAIQSINKLASSLRKIKTELGKGFNTDNLKSSIRSIAELAPTTKVATKEIGSLVSSFKNLKQEMSSGFNSKEFKNIINTLNEVNSKYKEVTKSISNQASLKKLSTDIQKATKIEPKSLEEYKNSLKGLFKDFQFQTPSTIPEIEKELSSLGKGYENLIEKQKKLIATNDGIEPDTKAYRNLLYDLSELVAKTQALSKARLEASKVLKEETKPSSEYPEDIQNLVIRGASDSPDTIAKLANAYDDLTDSAKRASEATAEVNKSIQTDDPSARANEFVNGQKEQAEEVKTVWEKAFENVQKNFQIPDSIKELEKLIPTLEKNLYKVRESFQTAIDSGKLQEGTDAWERYEYKVSLANEKLEATKDRLNELVALSKEVEAPQVSTPDIPTGNQGSDIAGKALTATVSFSTLSKTIGNFSKTLDGLSGKMSNVLTGLYAPLRHVVAEYKAKLGDIGNIFKKLGNTVSSATKTIKAKWDNLVHSFSKMVMRRALYAVLQTIIDAMGSLANFAGTTGQKFNEAMSNMTSSARYAGANIVAAFSPLVNSITPMIDALVEKLVGAITVINQFFAALTGNNVYVKAKKVVTDYAESVNKANKAQKDLVLGIDELNINNPDKNDSASGAAGEAYEWEEAPVLNKIKDFADKVKDILSKLFDPLKQAWDNAGDYVISGFKYMAGEISKLAASIGSDFLTMWQEEATVRIFENILGIIGDIEYTIGNLAHNFREAWEENNVGLHIFENLRDILAIIVEHVRNVTKYMKEWSKTINFKPLLDSFNGLLESLKPVADFIGGVFEDVMERVVLRHIKWLTEEGIPHLNDTLASIADAFDWGKLRSDIQPVEDAFANLAEAIHTGVVNALGNLGEALADITNSETFTSFMNNVASVINLIDADLVEKVLTALGDGILKVADAVVNFVGSEGFANFIDHVKEWLDGLTVEDIEGILGGLATTIVTFKFASFVGEGFANFMKFLTTVSAIKGANFEGLGTLLTTISGISLVIGGAVLAVKNFFDMWKEGWSPLKELLKDLGIAIGVVGAIILGVAAFPAVVVGAIVAAVSTIAIVIHDHWEEIKAWLGQVGGWINENVIQPVANLFSGLWESIKEIWGTVSGWFNDKVIQPIVSFFEGFKKRASQIWEGLKILVEATWIVVSTWFDEKVAQPVIKVFSTVKESVSNFFSTLWDGIKDIWGSVSEYFSKNVIDPLITVFSPIVDTITGFFDDIWKGIKKGAATCFNAVISVIEGAINGIIGGVNSFLNGFNWLVDKAASIAGRDWSGVDLIPKVTLSRIESYATGGFLGSPSSYSLFAAGENGIPEILGTVGGKSAVAGGEEITGIRDQVYESGIAEQALLNQAISLLQVIADKNFNVELDGRSMVSQLNNRSARNGYSMATVT